MEQRFASLTSLNGYDRYAAIRAGGLSGLRLVGTELGVAVARYLPRSANTLTALDLRCPHTPLAGAHRETVCTTRFCRQTGCTGRPRLIQVRYFSLPILSITALHTHTRPCCILALRSARLCLGGAPPSECRSNALGPEGATVVASCLRSLTALRDLDMWCGLC